MEVPMKREFLVLLIAIVFACSLNLAILAGAASAQTGKATVATKENVTTVSGDKDQESSPIKFEIGTYVFNWSCKGSALGLVLNDPNGDTAGVILISEPQSGMELFPVDNDSVKPGSLTLVMTSDGPWTITITKQDAATQTELPLTLSGAELKSVISKPFKAKAGKIKVKYAYKTAPEGTGTLRICNTATGAGLLTDVMWAGKAAGEFEVSVPAAGAFISQTTFPLASGGGDVTLSQ
jgi:hypothetical protein